VRTESKTFDGKWDKLRLHEGSENDERTTGQELNGARVMDTYTWGIEKVSERVVWNIVFGFWDANRLMNIGCDRHDESKNMELGTVWHCRFMASESRQAQLL
jgi:hypothetical protein